MRKFKRSLLLAGCVFVLISAVACGNKNKENGAENESMEAESVQDDNAQNDNDQSNGQDNDAGNKNQTTGNVKVGISSHNLIAEIPADIDYGTGEFADDIINYQRVGQIYYIGPKDYLALGDDRFVIYDRGGEQVVWVTHQGNKFYSVEGLNVEGLYNDGEDVLLKCSDDNYFPIKEDGTISKSAKKGVKINSIATDELEKMVQGDDRYVSVIRVDNEGNFYTHEEVFLPEYNVAYFEHRICKYDKDGKLLGYSLYYPDDFVAEPDHPVIVLEDGSIYRMVCEKNEIKIYKVTLGTADYYRLKSKVEAYMEKMLLEDENLPRVEYTITGYTHEALRDVLIRDKEFTDTDNGGKKTKLSNFCLVDGTDYDEKYFSVADTDKDGYYEVFVRQNRDLYVVFKYIDGEVYSYQIPSDKFLNTNGIMFENDVYFVPEFTVNGYTRFELAHSERTDDGEKFYIGDKLVEYDQYVYCTGANDNWKIAKKYYGTINLDYFASYEKFSEDNNWDFEKYARDSIGDSIVPQEIVDVIAHDKEFIYRWDYYESDDDAAVRMTKMSDITISYGIDLEKEIQRIESYVVVDFDHDGYCEVVVYLTSSPEDEVIIFHCENGIVYGYNFVVRAAKWIAPGGYLYGSSGAADNDTYTLVFDKDKYTQIEKCGTESDGTYYVDGKEVSEEEYLKVYDDVWGKGRLQEYESLLMLLLLAN